MSRVLVLADVHANAPALSAVLDAEPARDSVIFLGDAVDCGPHPNAVCEAFLDLDVIAGVSGNHDRSVLDVADSSGSDGDPHVRWREWTYDRLSEESRSFLGSLDRTATVSLGDRTFRLHHGDFPPPEGHDGPWRTRVTPEDDTSMFEAVADRYDEDAILLGHSHYPFEATIGGTTFLNPGSVGLQRDGWPANSARYMTIEDGAIDMREATYDTDALLDDGRSLDSPYLGGWDRSPTATRST